MTEIVGTVKALMLRGHAAAQVYGIPIEEIRALKAGEKITVESDVATKLITDGFAKEADHVV